MKPNKGGEFLLNLIYTYIYHSYVHIHKYTHMNAQNASGIISQSFQLEKTWYDCTYTSSFDVYFLILSGNKE